MFQVSGSLSTKMGVAPRYLIGLAEAEKVRLWQRTSSPLETPSKMSAKWIAAVPELRAATWLSLPKYDSRAFSNPSTFGPNGATQLVSKAILTYSCSVPPRCGEDRYIFSFMIKKQLFLYYENSFSAYIFNSKQN